MEPIRWLHLSDLHLGSPGRELWWQMEDELAPSLREWVKRLGPTDLVLLTGDLTNHGTAEHFKLVDQFLQRLLGWLGEAGCKTPPLVVPIPGNHDVLRPQGREAWSYLVLDHYGKGRDHPAVRLLVEELWKNRDGSFLAPLFAPYQAWFKRTILPQLTRPGVTFNRSHIPGDLTVELDLPERFPLCVVGLNSTWMQIKEGEFEGGLEMPTAQFHAALTKDPKAPPLEAFRRCRRALLLMHQPPKWLSAASRRDFEEEIYTVSPKERFAVCLHGHLHASHGLAISEGSGVPRRYFQVCSLLGREHYGAKNETRAIGYAWGQITADGEVRVWPLERVRRGDFVFDNRNFSGSEEAGHLVRPADTAPTKPRRKELRASAAVPAADPELDAYRAWAMERHRGLDLVGIGAGEVKLPFAEVYVPLRIAERSRHELDVLSGKGRGEPREAVLELGEIFHREPGVPHRLVFGEPGGGKTTALYKLLHLCLEGPEALGLVAGTLPVFLRLRRLSEADLGKRLAEVIERELVGISEGKLSVGLGRRLWQRGRLLLLLDGLDEIADRTLRQEVCSYLEWQLAEVKNQHMRAVVSCRDAGYGDGVELAPSFLPLAVQKLDAEQCRELVRSWFRAAQRAMPHYLESDARVAAAGLVAALDGADFRSQRLKVLVSTPLLLTLLCVVVLRGGEMPRHRAAFYEQCLRVLLESWNRSKRGEEAEREPLDVETTLEILGPLAWKLHAATPARRDDVPRVELVDHVEERLVELGRPDVSADRVVEWLHREAGVITDYAPQTFGFLHLGVQEYLAALHVAGQGEALLGALCERAGEEWWREVVQLLAGLGRGAFAPFMRRLLRSPLLLERADLLRACLEEAPSVELEPFLEMLEPGTEPERQAAVLRLLQGRQDPRLVEKAQAIAKNGDEDVRALVEQVSTHWQQRQGGGSPAARALLLVHHSSARTAAVGLRERLVRQGLEVHEVVDPVVLQGRLESLRGATRGVLVLLGPGAAPWEERVPEHVLRIFQRARRPLLGVRLVEGGEGAAPPSWLEEAMGKAVIDLRQDVSAVVRSIERGLAAEAPLVRLAAGDRAGVVAGELFVEPVTGMRLLWIPGGSFRMGGDAYTDEQPIHRVRLSSFWLGETPVTNRQYGVHLAARTAAANPAEEPLYWRDRRYSVLEQPVVGVSWLEAVAFCRWLSEVSGIRVQLPTEAQWEYAARGPDGREYPWGNEGPDATRACFGLEYGIDQPSPVGSFPSGRGPFGTLDQAGNVWEWCQDFWDAQEYKKRAGSSEAVDPVQVGKVDPEIDAVLRGGGWLSPAASLRSAYRFWHWARGRSDEIGFRVVVAPASS